MNLNYVCFTQYDETMPNVKVAFKPKRLENTFGEYISKNSLNQLRIAETEKYAHVTFFFNGGEEKQYPGEDRILVPSPKVETYDMKPEMSALEVTEKVVDAINSKKYDTIILNYANPDMVGHTGNLEATVKALENIDKCLGMVLNTAFDNFYTVVLLSDHGNCDYMLDENDNPIFTQKELKIVGIVDSPLYISSERGSSSLGSGSISLYIYCKEDVINLDYYTEIAVQVKGAKELVTNSNEYLAVVNPVIQKIEMIKEERQEARYNSLVNDANKKIDDAQKEYDDKKAEADQELADAEQKINDAKSELDNSENKLNKSEKELNQKEKDVAKQFETAEQQIEQYENQINAMIAQIGMETPEITAQKEQIQKQKKELETQKNTANNQIASGRKEIEDGRKKIKDARKELEENEQEYNDKKAEAEEKLADAQSKIDDARADITKIEKAKWYIQDRTDNTGYSNIFDAIKTMKNISKIFPVIFYLVAILISLTSMTRMIEEERIEIGTLKALGYTNLQIISKYILYAFLACIIGGFLGMTLCFYILPKIVWTLYSMVYTMPHFYMTYRLSIGLMGILIAFICIGGATLIVAYRELKEMPSVLMRPKAPKNGKRIFMERITFLWKRFNFSQKVTARNIFRYKKRAIMTIIGIAGCTGLMLTGFGIRDSVIDIPSVQFRKIFSYDLSISLTNTKGLGELNEYFSNI